MNARRQGFLGATLEAAYDLNTVRAALKDKLHGIRHVATRDFLILHP